jgi:hypothetical protein
MWIKFIAERDSNWTYVWCEDEDPVALVEQYLKYRGLQNTQYKLKTILEDNEYRDLLDKLTDRLAMIQKQIRSLNNREVK